jgi:hypothetical protein
MIKLSGAIILVVASCFASTSFSAGAPELDLTITDVDSDDSPFSAGLIIKNPSHELEKVQVFIAVNTKSNTLWFYPHWTSWPPQIGWETMDIPAVSEITVDIVPDMPGLQLPDEFCCVNIYAALKHHGELIGEPVRTRFGWNIQNRKMVTYYDLPNVPEPNPVKGVVITIIMGILMVLIAVFVIATTLPS